MTEEQIIEDAKAAGLTISASGDILMEYYGDWIVITDALTKFAQLQAARQFNQRNEAVAISQDSIELLAMELASEEHDDIHELIWEGGAVPEPWGEVWQKYEDDAKRILTLAAKYLPMRYDTQTNVVKEAAKLIKDLSGVVRAQNGNKFEDINELLFKAEQFLITQSTQPESEGK